MKLTIDTEGKIDEDLILQILKSKNIQQIVDKKADLKINEIVNQYFNSGIIQQSGKEQFKQTLNRLIIEHSFDPVFYSLLKDAIKSYLGQKEIESIIKTTAKEHIKKIISALS